ncbi:MAG TPA: alpha/beta hydrolase [Polyangiaceae bacterium]|nr:alpha/beta hydrolase [Polyangiaceae bacterium]
MEPAPLNRVADGPPLPDGAAAWVMARSGRRLRSARFTPPGTARGSVVVSTGRTEPIEKYGEVIGELLLRGFVVLAHDWAGQGLSTRFGDDPLACDVVGGCYALADDFRDVLDAHAASLPKPWFALAHSMGAALNALVLSEGEPRFAGAVLSAPMIQFAVGALPFWLIRGVVATAGRVAGDTRLARRQVDPAELAFEKNVCTHDRTRYERVRTLYRAHPELSLGEPTWRWLDFAVDLRERLVTPGAAERIACPLVAILPGDDRIVKSEATRFFVARVPRGKVVDVAGAFHEILMETDELRARFWRAFDALVTDGG